MMSFSAYRLTPLLMDLYRSGEKVFTPEGLAKKGVSYNNLFEEVPVIIKNSNLASTLLCEIEDMSNITDTDSFLSLATGSYLEKSVQLLMEGVDELCQDAQKSTYCQQLNQFASQSFAKLYTAEKIHNDEQQ